MEKANKYKMGASIKAVLKWGKNGAMEKYLIMASSNLKENLRQEKKMVMGRSISKMAIITKANI
jgi:hypothetical protein